MIDLKTFVCSDEAATTVEYAVMLALILGAIMASIGTFGGETSGLWGGIDTKLDNAGMGS